MNRGFVAKEAESKIEHIIYGMRYLKICVGSIMLQADSRISQHVQVYPLEAFEEAAEFIEALAAVFDAASGFKIKVALASVLTSLLAPVIKVRLSLLSAHRVSKQSLPGGYGRGKSPPMAKGHGNNSFSGYANGI